MLCGKGTNPGDPAYARDGHGLWTWQGKPWPTDCPLPRRAPCVSRAPTREPAARLPLPRVLVLALDLVADLRASSSAAAARLLHRAQSVGWVSDGVFQSVA
ncbi:MULTISPECIES: hypothetical protein [unclassified Streptomyces]|uniref:hypothetical protein n=1 Tax=unclassified Streptomyces TaxID=2593676 RepID=UPI002E2BAF78|nr:hypothetical protein [Streptomyces sp. NBC_01423]WSX95106.1 hypothetical protein OH827_33210 [Streptomyces sp. NBC_00891]WSY09586.1 hypothetical protein OG464_33215 [Streptomyces sp. NBC_00890]WSZ11206.1 hypothetical protein OG704_33215 [Streptomyces sp. NBC_00869]WSZ21288.1 hypothetical protein OG498_00350 [Streptomyces sp. NBC_00870]